MSAPPGILVKIQKLLNLATSSNQNEADSAKAMAEKLMAKYNITELDLSVLDPKEYYSENEKLFSTIGLSTWRQQLAVAVSGFFDCQIVMEMIMPTEGIEQYTYFVYGDDDQVKDVQFVYHAFEKKIINLVDVHCLGRGPIYISSYCDGVVDSVKWNIQMYGIDLPDGRKILKQEEEKAPPPKSNTIVKTGDNKEEPTDNRIDINKGQIIKDIMAYFRGIDDGKNLSLTEILELAVQNESVQEMKE
jgi:Protein of unknown function (DUF2786)